jgi:hypothetical protein
MKSPAELAAAADAAGKWLAALDVGARARFSASFSFEVTIAGRDSYVVHADGSSNPFFWNF